MSSYSTQDVARLLGLSAERVRSYVRSGVLTPLRGPRGEYWFSFQDIVLLRTAAGLSQTVPRRKVMRALKHLRHQLPEGSSLTSVRITADGGDIVAKGNDAVWKPESGQLQFDFATTPSPSSDNAESDSGTVSVLLPRRTRDDDDDDWQGTGRDPFKEGLALESLDVFEAENAYRRALERDPADVDARINLGRLLHEAGKVAEAEDHYRAALSVAPHNAVAAFNLGVALEDLGLLRDAVDAYTHALTSDPNHADTHYNLSRLYDQAGDRAAALRHLVHYSRLSGLRPT